MKNFRKHNLYNSIRYNSIKITVPFHSLRICTAGTNLRVKIYFHTILPFIIYAACCLLYFKYPRKIQNTDQTAAISTRIIQIVLTSKIELHIL